MECAEVTRIEVLEAGNTNGWKGGQLQSPSFEILMSPNVPKLGSLGFRGRVP